MRVRLCLASVAAVVLVPLVLVPSAVAVNPLKIKPGKYVGTITSGLSQGETSFKLDQGGRMKDFSIVFSGEPFCSQPVPESWNHPLPQSGDFRVLEDFRVIKGGAIYPDGSELSYGFYPFPVVQESHQVSGFMQLDAEFTSRKRAAGYIFVAGDDFIPPTHEGDCRYFVPGGNWQVKRKG
jgi:hypothetical protein